MVRLDVTNRTMTIATKDGTPASTPVKPTAERSASICEMILAQIYVAAGASSITQANITDTRADTTVCGWVTGLIDQVDTSTLFAQWQDAYARYYAETTAEFDDFMEHLTQDLGVLTYLTSFGATYTEYDASTGEWYLAQEFSQYSHGDIVFAYRNGLMLQAGTHYEIQSSANGDVLRVLYTPKTGNTLTIRILKTNIGIAPTT